MFYGTYKGKPPTQSRPLEQFVAKFFLVRTYVVFTTAHYYPTIKFFFVFFVDRSCSLSVGSRKTWMTST